MDRIFNFSAGNCLSGYLRGFGRNLTAFGSYRRDLQRDANGDSSARKRPAGNRRVDDGEEGGGSSS